MSEDVAEAPSASGTSNGGKKEIDRLSIEPAKNGGHTVRHNYKSRPIFRKGSMNGGMSRDYPESEEFVFGPDDNDKMLAHVTKALGLKKRAAEGK